MIEGFREAWRQLQRSAPGRRFQESQQRRQRTRPSPLRRVLSIAMGVAVTAVGVVLLFIPGPGILFVALGAALFARESAAAARALDRGELHVRRLVTHVGHMWGRSRRRGR